MKIVRLTSPLPDVHCLSSPRQKLRHGRKHALLSRPDLTLNLCTLSFVLYLALLPHLPPLLFFPTVLPFKESAFVFADYLKSHFSVSQPQTLRSRARCYLSELRRATCPEESHSPFCSPFSSVEFLEAFTSLSSSTATDPDKVACPILRHLPRSGMDFLLPHMDF